MDEQEILKDVVVETTKAVAKDVYVDTLKPTAQNVGGFFGTLSGFFNHVVVYPLKKLNIVVLRIPIFPTFMYGELKLTMQ